jgi:hypothetical protein
MKSILSSLTIPLIATASMLGASAIFPQPALADKDEIDLADAPNAVQETILDAAAQGTLDDVKLKYFQGQPLYVAEIDLPGKRDLDVYVAADGSLVRTEEDVTWAALPAPVQATLQQQIGRQQAGRDGRLDDLSRVTVGKTVTFSAEIELRGQQPRSETELDVEIAANGKLLSAVESHDD